MDECITRHVNLYSNDDVLYVFLHRLSSNGRAQFVLFAYALDEY